MTLGKLIEKLQFINDSVRTSNIGDAEVLFVPDGILSDATDVCSVQVILDTDGENGENVVLLGEYSVEAGV